MLPIWLLTLLMAVGDNDTPLTQIMEGDWWGALWAPYSPIAVMGEFAIVIIYLVAQTVLYIKLQDAAPVSISMIIWGIVMFPLMSTPVRFVMISFVFVAVAALLWRLLKK